MIFISPLADRPGTFPCFVMKFFRSPPRMKAASISTPPLAQAAIRARFWRRPARACLRSIAIPPPSPRARLSPPRRMDGCFWSRRGSRSSPRSRSVSILADFDARRARHRRLLDAARRRRRAASPSAATARSTCAWSRAGPSAADIVNTARRGDARRHPLSFRRGAGVAAHRPRDRARPRQGAVRFDRRARRHDRARRAGQAWRDASGDARVPGAAHRRQRRTRRTRPRARRRRSGSEAGRAARRRHLPFARGSHRQAVLRRAVRARRGALAPPAGRTGPAAADLPRRRASSRSTPTAAEIAANPRARSAKLRHGERTAAPRAPGVAPI